MRHAASSADQRYFLGTVWKFDFNNTRRSRSVPKVEYQESVEKTAPDLVVELRDIRFAFDSYHINLDTESDKLEYVKSKLQSGRTIEKVIIEGHACQSVKRSIT